MKNFLNICKCFIIINLMVAFYVTIFADYTLGDMKMETELDILSAYAINLNDINKITIETHKYSLRPYQHMIIVEEDVINHVVAGLKKTTKNPHFHTRREDYTITFWKDNEKKFVIGLVKGSQTAFIRDRNKFLNDYSISSEFYDFWVSLLYQ